MKLTQIPPEHFDLAPARCFDDIKQVVDLANGERDMGHVCAALASGENQLWVYWDEQSEHIGTVVTRIIDFDAMRACVIEYCAGPANAVQDYFNHIEEIETWARYNGCQETRIVGRKGWRRVLRDYGYEHQYEVLGKKL